jgi:hypothetical protein
MATPGRWTKQKRGDYPTGIRLYGYDGRASTVAEVYFEEDADAIVGMCEVLQEFVDRFPDGDEGMDLAASMMLDAQLQAARVLLAGMACPAEPTEAIES